MTEEPLQSLSHPATHILELSLSGKILPLMGICLKIVEFLTPIRIENVAPSCGADGIVPLIENCRDLPSCFFKWIPEKGHDRLSIEIARCYHSAEIG